MCNANVSTKLTECNEVNKKILEKGFELTGFFYLTSLEN